MIRAAIFDLDGTLYDGSTYVRGAWRDIASYLGSKYGRDREALLEGIEAVWRRLGAHERHLFDRFLEDVRLPAAEVPVLVDLFHQHEPEIRLYPESGELLDALRPRLRMGLLTNGERGMQLRKLDALGIRDLFDPLVLAGDYPRELWKPSPHLYAKALRILRFQPHEVVAIGDDPAMDFAGPEALGMPSIRILRGEHARVRSAGPWALETADLDEVHRWVLGMEMAR